MLPSVNMIGCGKLGKTIAKLFVNSSIAIISGVVNLSKKSAQEAIAFIGQGSAVETLQALPAADIYFITTPDDVIQSIAELLDVKEKTIVVHCSGLLSSDVLLSLKNKGCYVASLHPNKSFANLEQSIATFSGTYCAIEGDKEAVLMLTALFEKLGGRVFSIQKENKKIYHAGAVMANNYCVTLHAAATQCYKNAGVAEDVAQSMVSILMQDALNNLQALSHAHALTGPIQRGDVETVRQHLMSLESMRDIKALYVSLGLATLLLTKQPASKIERLKTILLG